MKLLKVYNGSVFIGTESTIMFPPVESDEEYDITALTDEEVEAFSKNLKDENLLKKVIKLTKLEEVK